MTGGGALLVLQPPRTKEHLMSDTTTGRKYGDMTITELLTSARSELVGLVELAQSMADGTNTQGRKDLELYIGAYHGSIAARIAVAETKYDLAGLLTAADASAIAGVLQAATTNAKVGRLVNGKVFSGTARAIVADTNGARLGNDDDLRNGYLWVTLRVGWEVFWPVRDLMAQYRTGEFVVNYEEAE
jgi:hypothetical protein